jgi:hypothetical protein
MIIVKNYPPNIGEIRKHFTVHKRVLFTYGEFLYNPSGEEIPDHLMVHEETHESQQSKMGVKEWWDRYFVDVAFRLSQEIEAYHAQYEFFAKNANYSERMKFLGQLADALSSPIYGKCISRTVALFRIKMGH